MQRQVEYLQNSYLIKNLYSEYIKKNLQCNNKKKNNPIFKMVLNRLFNQEEAQMSNKHFKNTQHH